MDRDIAINLIETLESIKEKLAEIVTNTTPADSGGGSDNGGGGGGAT